MACSHSNQHIFLSSTRNSEFNCSFFLLLKCVFYRIHFLKFFLPEPPEPGFLIATVPIDDSAFTIDRRRYGIDHVLQVGNNNNVNCIEVIRANKGQLPCPHCGKICDRSNYSATSKIDGSGYPGIKYWCQKDILNHTFRMLLTGYSIQKIKK